VIPGLDRGDLTRTTPTKMEQLPCLTPEDFDGACDELLTSIQKIDRATPAVRTRHEVRMLQGRCQAHYVRQY